MEKKRSDSWPEVVFSSSDNRENQAIRRAVHQGQLRKIAPKIYTSNQLDPPKSIIGRHRLQILNHLFPGAVISHRSALEGGIDKEGSIVMTYKYTKVVKLPGLVVKLFKGPGADRDDTPFMDNLFISSRGRAFLENLQSSRARQTKPKTLSISSLEKRLDHIVRIYGIDELNQIRDQAREVGMRLQLNKEFSKFDKMISAFMGTHSASELQSDFGKARSVGEPFDPNRVELFATLCAYLQKEYLTKIIKEGLSSSSWFNEAFFESYFSNYIEGTIFEIEEAKQIIFDSKIFQNRPEDSHDILGTYQIVSNRKEMLVVPESPEQLIEILKHRHSQLMQVREDKTPGQFKDRVNRAGNTVFVSPEEVRGTLRKGFLLYQQLPLGFSRAAFMMFLIAEVHPFLDGNGRIARIMMNAEFDAANECRIIIPTVYRDDYLLALRKLSRQSDPRVYIKMLKVAQKFTASISFDDYEHALLQLKAANAFSEPSDAQLRLKIN